MWIDDELLKRCAEGIAISCWVPQQPLVVLGSSNDPATEVQVDACAAAGIPVLKRCGGGGTVLLYDGCVVVSVGAWVRQHYQSKLYFQLLNQAVIDCLALKWPRFAQLGQKGLSDITDGNRKVAGTSLFRSRNYLLYQASLLIELNLPAIDRYLQHPTREPDYRLGRGHAEFLAGLADLEPGLTAAACVQQLQTSLQTTLLDTLSGELIEPEPAQFPGLWQRAAGAYA